MKFYSLRIKDIKKETDNCVSVSFDIPDTLQQEFAYNAGQYITLKTNVNEQEVRRSYSLCSSPFEKDFRVAIKQIENGVFSTYANNELKIGNTIDVALPNGKFGLAISNNATRKIIAIAAGSGITPILSIVNTTLTANPNSEVILIYGNKNSNSIIFKEKLEALKNKFLHRLQLIHILSREKTDAPINSGRINEEKLQQLSKLIDWKNGYEYFICGPEEMIINAKKYFENIGINPQHIHLELFTTTNKSKQKTSIINNNKTAQSTITIKADGRTFDIEMGFNEELSILDAALKNGADLPFACKGGMCCTCKAKLIDGQVEMDVNWGLEHDEIEKGYILTCQSHPITEKVVVDFDIK